MRENHHIDDLFRESIDKYGISPSDKVWASIDKKLQSKAVPSGKSKLGKSYLTGALIVAGSLGLLATYYFLPKENKKIALTTTAKQELVQSSPEKQNTSDQTTDNINAVSNQSVSKSNSAIVLQNAKANENTKLINYEAEKMNTSMNVPFFTDRFEKSEPEPFVPIDRKDNSFDKAILMMPYFQSGQTQVNANAANTSATNAAAEKNNNESAAEVQTKPTTQNAIYVPNAFTPNADGLNDMFMPQTNETFKEYKLYIFDRAGNNIFYSDELHRGWDGHAIINGNEVVKEDIYMWRIEIKNNKGEKEHMMGYLNLIK